MSRAGPAEKGNIELLNSEVLGRSKGVLAAYISRLLAEASKYPSLARRVDSDRKIRHVIQSEKYNNLEKLAYIAGVIKVIPTTNLYESYQENARDAAKWRGQEKILEKFYELRSLLGKKRLKESNEGGVTETTEELNQKIDQARNELIALIPDGKKRLKDVLRKFNPSTSNSLSRNIFKALESIPIIKSYLEYLRNNKSQLEMLKEVVKSFKAAARKVDNDYGVMSKELYTAEQMEPILSLLNNLGVINIDDTGSISAMPGVFDITIDDAPYVIRAVKVDTVDTVFDYQLVVSKQDETFFTIKYNSENKNFEVEFSALDQSLVEVFMEKVMSFAISRKESSTPSSSPSTSSSDMEEVSFELGDGAAYDAIYETLKKVQHVTSEDINDLLSRDDSISIGGDGGYSIAIDGGNIKISGKVQIKIPLLPGANGVIEVDGIEEGDRDDFLANLNQALDRKVADILRIHPAAHRSATPEPAAAAAPAPQPATPEPAAAAAAPGEPIDDPYDSTDSEDDELETMAAAAEDAAEEAVGAAGFVARMGAAAVGNRGMSNDEFDKEFAALVEDGDDAAAATPDPQPAAAPSRTPSTTPSSSPMATTPNPVFRAPPPPAGPHPDDAPAAAAAPAPMTKEQLREKMNEMINESRTGGAKISGEAEKAVATIFKNNTQIAEHLPFTVGDKEIELSEINYSEERPYMVFVIKSGDSQGKKIMVKYDEENHQLSVTISNKKKENFFLYDDVTRLKVTRLALDFKEVLNKELMKENSPLTQLIMGMGSGRVLDEGPAPADDNDEYALPDVAAAIDGSSLSAGDSEEGSPAPEDDTITESRMDILSDIRPNMSDQEKLRVAQRFVGSCAVDGKTEKSDVLQELNRFKEVVVGDTVLIIVSMINNILEGRVDTPPSFQSLGDEDLPAGFSATDAAKFHTEVDGISKKHVEGDEGILDTLEKLNIADLRDEERVRFMRKFQAQATAMILELYEVSAKYPALKDSNFSPIEYMIKMFGTQYGDKSEQLIESLRELYYTRMVTAVYTLKTGVSDLYQPINRMAVAAYMNYVTSAHQASLDYDRRGRQESSREAMIEFRKLVSKFNSEKVKAERRGSPAPDELDTKNLEVAKLIAGSCTTHYHAQLFTEKFKRNVSKYDLSGIDISIDRTKRVNEVLMRAYETEFPADDTSLAEEFNSGEYLGLTPSIYGDLNKARQVQRAQLEHDIDKFKKANPDLNQGNIDVIKDIIAHRIGYVRGAAPKPISVKYTYTQPEKKDVKSFAKEFFTGFDKKIRIYHAKTFVEMFMQSYVSGYILGQTIPQNAKILPSGQSFEKFCNDIIVPFFKENILKIKPGKLLNEQQKGAINNLTKVFGEFYAREAVPTPVSDADRARLRRGLADHHGQGPRARRRNADGTATSSTDVAMDLQSKLREIYLVQTHVKTPYSQIATKNDDRNVSYIELSGGVYKIEFDPSRSLPYYMSKNGHEVAYESLPSQSSAINNAHKNLEDKINDEINKHANDATASTDPVKREAYFAEQEDRARAEYQDAIRVVERGMRAAAAAPAAATPAAPPLVTPRDPATIDADIGVGDDGGYVDAASPSAGAGVSSGLASAGGGFGGLNDGGVDEDPYVYLGADPNNPPPVFRGTDTPARPASVHSGDSGPMDRAGSTGSGTSDDSRSVELADPRTLGVDGAVTSPVGDIDGDPAAADAPAAPAADVDAAPTTPDGVPEGVPQEIIDELQERLARLRNQALPTEPAAAAPVPPPPAIPVDPKLNGDTIFFLEVNIDLIRQDVKYLGRKSVKAKSGKYNGYDVSINPSLSRDGKEVFALKFSNDDSDPKTIFAYYDEEAKQFKVITGNANGFAADDADGQRAAREFKRGLNMDLNQNAAGHLFEIIESAALKQAKQAKDLRLKNAKTRGELGRLGTKIKIEGALISTGLGVYRGSRLHEESEILTLVRLHPELSDFIDKARAVIKSIDDFHMQNHETAEEFLSAASDVNNEVDAFKTYMEDYCQNNGIRPANENDSIPERVNQILGHYKAQSKAIAENRQKFAAFEEMLSEIQHKEGKKTSVILEGERGVKFKIEIAQGGKRGYSAFKQYKKGDILIKRLDENDDEMPGYVAFGEGKKTPHVSPKWAEENNALLRMAVTSKTEDELKEVLNGFNESVAEASLSPEDKAVNRKVFAWLSEGLDAAAAPPPRRPSPPAAAAAAPPLPGAVGEEAEEVRYLERFLAGSKVKPAPKVPYRGIGVRMVVRENDLEIQSVVDPDNGRFVVADGARAAEIMQKGAIITHLEYRGEMTPLSEILKFSDPTILPSILHSEGEVKFTVKDKGGTEHQVTCDNSRSIIAYGADGSLQSFVKAAEDDPHLAGNIIRIGREMPDGPRDRRGVSPTVPTAGGRGAESRAAEVRRRQAKATRFTHVTSI